MRGHTPPPGPQVPDVEWEFEGEGSQFQPPQMIVQLCNDRRRDGMAFIRGSAARSA